MCSQYLSRGRNPSAARAGRFGAHFGHREHSDQSIVNSQTGIMNTERQVLGRSGATPGGWV